MKRQILVPIRVSAVAFPWGESIRRLPSPSARSQSCETSDVEPHSNDTCTALSSFEFLCNAVLCRPFELYQLGT